MTTAALLALAEVKQHDVIYTSLTENESISINIGKCFIAIDTKLFGTHEKETLAHELGHCEYGGFYNIHAKCDIREKAERRADKWAFSKLIPIGEVRQAFSSGLREIWEIADHFDISCEYAGKAMSYYHSLGLI